MPMLKSWVASANAPAHPFPLNNLPCGVFSASGAEARCGVAIGDMILDMAALSAAGLVDFGDVFDLPFWNDFIDLGPSAWDALRGQLTDLLGEKSPDWALIEPHLVAMDAATLHMPVAVSEYTDFYAGRHHATNVGTMFRGAENALPPNWLHTPIGYNGRASTVVVSGTDIIRPNGQTKSADRDMPTFGPTKRLDFELELGAVVGGTTELGETLSVAQADRMIFGYVLLNDWSARDIQAWEYQPLGPFQAKAFATSISPWIVTTAALEPFRCMTPPREVPLLPHLADVGPMLFDIDLAVTMRAVGGEPTAICRTNYREMYYSAAQQLAHHASSGCAMNTGDLLGSGTISGPDKDSRGSLLELTWGGKEPLTLEGGTVRTFIEDGDTLTLHGAAHGDGFTVGFGVCTGTILPART